MGKYKHGKPNQEINVEDLQQAIEKGHFTDPLRHKSYLAILYWIGCRRAEPFEVKKEDVKQEGESLFINIPAFKGGKRGGLIELALSLYGVNLIKDTWEKTKPNKPLWNFSSKTGYRIIKRIWPTRTPHWLRHNRITKIRKKIDGKTFSLDDAKSFTGIKSDRTMQTYGMKTQEGIHRVAQVLE